MRKTFFNIFLHVHTDWSSIEFHRQILIHKYMYVGYANTKCVVWLKSYFTGENEANLIHEWLFVALQQNAETC